MKLTFNTGATLAALTLTASLALPAYAQKTTPPASAQVNTETGSPVTRAPMKMDTKEFLRTHRWDEATDTWMMNANTMPPAGVMSRAEVRAQRDTFLANNRWNNVASQYEPVGPKPRDMSKLTRAQVKAETIQFMRTHSYNEETSAWIDMPMPMRKDKTKM